jgi:hypothetical protein
MTQTIPAKIDGYRRSGPPHDYKEIISAWKIGTSMSFAM